MKTYFNLCGIVLLTFLGFQSISSGCNNQENQAADDGNLKDKSRSYSSSVPISNLPSSISYLGITPKLMMNPSIEDAGGAIERLIVGETRPFNSVISNRLGMGLEAENVIDVSSSYTITSVAVSSNQHQEVSNEGSEGKQESEQFNQATNIANPNTDPLKKASEPEKQRNEQLIDLWKKVANQYETAADHRKKYAEKLRAYETESQQEYARIAQNARDARIKADQLKEAAVSCEKSTQSESLGDQPVELLSLKIIEHYQLLADYYRKSEEAYAQGNEAEGERLGGSSIDEYGKGAGCIVWRSIKRLQAAIKLLEQAADAEKKGNQPVATLLRKAAEQDQVAAEYYQKSAEAYALGSEKINCHGRNRFYQAGESTEQSVHRLKDAATFLEKAIVAENNNNKTLASLWQEIAGQKQVAAEYYQKGTEVYASGDEEGGKSAAWDAYRVEKIIEALKEAATSLEKAFEAANSGNQNLSDIWQKVVSRYEFAAEHHKKSIEARAINNKQEEDLFNKAASSANDSARLSVDQLKKSLEYIENTRKDIEQLNEANKLEDQSLTSLWQKIVTQNQDAAEYYQQAAEAYLKENTTEAERLVKDADAIRFNIEHSLKRTTGELKAAIRQSIWYAEKVAEAKESQSQRISDLWEKTAEQYQLLVEHYRKGAEALLRGNKEEIECFNNASWVLESSAKHLTQAVNYIEEAIQLEKSENQFLYDFLINTAEQYQDAAEYERKYAEARMVGNEQEKRRWKEASSYASNSVERFKKSAKAFKTFFSYQEDQSIANLWEQVAEANQTTAGYWRKAAEAEVAGDEQNINRFKYAADSARYGADHLSKAVDASEKALKADTQGNQFFYVIWRKISERKQVAAEHYKKVAEAEALGTYIPPSEYNRLDDAACYASWSAEALEQTAIALEKATEAEKKDNQALATLWRKAVEHNQVAANQYEKAYEAYVS